LISTNVLPDPRFRRLIDETLYCPRLREALKKESNRKGLLADEETKNPILASNLLLNAMLPAYESAGVD
jgi:hypothetical protein